MEQDMKDFAFNLALDPLEMFSHLMVEKQEHSMLVSELTADLLKYAYESELILLEEEYSIEEVKEAVRYHDIGFVLIPERLQCKIEPVTQAEFRTIGRHTVYGGKILERWQEKEPSLKRKRMWQLAGELALSHHEQWNGKGYPYGIRATAIPELSRVLAIVDAYDAITRGACYRMPLPGEFAMVEMSVCAGKQFDPEYTDVLLEYLKKLY